LTTPEKPRVCYLFFLPDGTDTGKVGGGRERGRLHLSLPVAPESRSYLHCVIKKVARSISLPAAEPPKALQRGTSPLVPETDGVPRARLVVSLSAPLIWPPAPASYYRLALPWFTRSGNAQHPDSVRLPRPKSPPSLKDLSTAAAEPGALLLPAHQNKSPLHAGAEQDTKGHGGRKRPWRTGAEVH
ncbi:hypothetical protein E2320_020800, partial [Naja naja]